MNAMASALASFATAFSPVFQSSANHEHQQGGAVPCSARRLPHSRFSHPAKLSRAGHLPVSVMTRAPGLSFDAIRLPAGLVQHLPTHPVLKFLRGRWAFHFSKRLSSSPSLDGFKTIEKAFGDGRISFGGQQIVFPG